MTTTNNEFKVGEMPKQTLECFLFWSKLEDEHRISITFCEGNEPNWWCRIWMKFFFGCSFRRII